jgi:hypothetical protein
MTDHAAHIFVTYDLRTAMALVELAEAAVESTIEAAYVADARSVIDRKVAEYLEHARRNDNPGT